MGAAVTAGVEVACRGRQVVTSISMVFEMAFSRPFTPSMRYSYFPVRRSAASVYESLLNFVATSVPLHHDWPTERRSTVYVVAPSEADHDRTTSGRLFTQRLSGWLRKRGPKSCRDMRADK
jgi:hypothetical protein